MGIYDDEDYEGKIRRQYRGAARPLRPIARHAVKKDLEEPEAKLRELEENIENMSDEEKDLLRSGAQKLESGEGMNDEELGAYNKYLGLQGEDKRNIRESSSDDMMDKLNKGYTGSGDKKTKMSERYNSSNKLKRRIAIAGAAAGGSAIGGALIFVALLPLKLEFIVQNIEHRFEAAATQAMEQQTTNLLSRYITQSVLPSINRGKCRSTIDPACVVTPAGSGPFKQLYTAWAQGGLERKLATQYGIVLGKEGNSFYLSVHGNDVPISTAQFADMQAGRMSIFDLDGTKQVSRNEIRTAVKDAFKDSTKWNKAYTRFKVGKLLEAKYGIKRCVIACKIRDHAADTVADKTLAAQAFLLQRVMPEKYGLVLTCVLSGATGSCDPSKLDSAAAGENERMTPFQKQLQQQMADFAAKFGDDSLKDLAKLAGDISKDGLKKVIARKAITAIVGSLGGDAAGLAAGGAAEKAVPVVGWVVLIAGLISGAAGIGALLSHAAFEANSATAAQTFETFNTVSAECMTEHCDPTELGSFDHVLATSITNNDADSVDFTADPAWQHYFGGTDTSATTSASIFSALLPGKASAAGIPNTRYLCDDNKPVPIGQLICPEMNFIQDGSKAASTISDAVNTVPGIVPISKFITTVGNIPSEWIGKGLAQVPGFSDFTNWVGSLAAGPLQWVQDQLITAPNLTSGARIVDMMMAGGSVIGQASCQALGCPKATPKGMADVQNQQIAEEKAEFESRPLVARIFSTDTPHSLVGHLAMSMPSTFSDTVGVSISSLLTNPFAKLGGMFSALFSTNMAFAAETPIANPWGGSVLDNAYLSTQIPTDPEGFFNANCVNGPLAKYDASSMTLDISDWLNAPGNVHMDDKSGLQVNDKPNQCPLVLSAIQSAGVTSDSKFIPQGAANADQ